LQENLDLPSASEAFLQYKEIENNIEQLLNRLLLIQSNNTESTIVRNNKTYWQLKFKI